MEEKARYILVILILMVLLNSGETLFSCLVNGKIEQYYPADKLCCNGLHPRVENGIEMKCCYGKKVNDSHSHQCCNGTVNTQSLTQLCCGNIMHDNENQNLVCCGDQIYNQGQGICCADKFTRTGDGPLRCVNGTAVQKPTPIDNDESSHATTTKHIPSVVPSGENDALIETIVDEIKNDELQTPNVTLQPQEGPPKCPSCITRNHSGRRRFKLNVRLEKIERRKRDRVWLHVTVTRPKKYAGRRMRLKTQRASQTCFKKGVVYVIFTNR